MSSALSGQKVLVFGLAKSGVAAIRLLLAHGAEVTALDARDEATLGEVARELKYRAHEKVLSALARELHGDELKANDTDHSDGGAPDEYDEWADYSQSRSRD